MKLTTYVVAMTLLAPWAHAESLADAAKRERERRERRERSKEQGVKPVRVITQDDVKTNDSDTSEANESPTMGETASDTTFEADARDAKEKQWRSRAQAARSRLETARKTLAKTPPGITTPGMTVGTAPPGVRRLEGIGSGGPTISPNPAYAAAQAEVAAAEKAITDLEEEARRAGALPGWLR